MNRELEFKLLDLDLDYYKSLILSKGAKLIAHEIQTNTIIDSSLFPLIEKNSYLRIREVKDLLNNVEKKELTFKKKIDNNLVRENLEYTIEFDNLDNLLKILENLKLNKFITGKKERYSYKYKDVRLDFDTWDKNTYPYPYIEIEGKNEEVIFDLLEEIGIDKKHISLKSIAELQDDLKS